MLRTKKEVDKHVADILTKIHNENERNIRGFNFARQYFSVKDYETAKRYLAGYLTVNERHAAAHKLMGQIHEASGNLEQALQSYKRSLELEDNQRDVVLKICDLYCQLTVDPTTARYWVERAERLYPHHPTVFKLRECIVSADGDANAKELEDLITNELAARPKDVLLRIKLLRLYLDTERAKDAYTQAMEIESKQPYSNCVEWYHCLADIFEIILQDEVEMINEDFFVNYLAAIDNLVRLTHAEPHTLPPPLSNRLHRSHSIADAAEALLTFDKILKNATSKPWVKEGVWAYVLNYMTGQMYYYLGTLLLKRAKKEQGNWKEACQMGAALFLVAYTFKPGNLSQEGWFIKKEDKQKFLLQLWKQGNYRLSVTGHVISSLCKDDKAKWLQRIKQDVCIPQVRERIYQRLFGSISARRQNEDSMFLKDSTFLQCTLEFPDSVSLKVYDGVAYKHTPGSLNHLVWLALHTWSVQENSWVPVDYVSALFENLSKSSSNLTSGAPETLCHLDIEAFLLAAAYCSGIALETRRSRIHSRAGETCLSVPPDISDPLCTEEQSLWWRLAYTLHSSSVKEKLGELRRTIQRGLEVIRGVGNHGLDISLIIHLARMFAEKASHLRSVHEEAQVDDISILEARSAHYWQVALNTLEKLSSNHAVTVPRERFFPVTGNNLSMEQIQALIEEGELFLGCRLMNTGKLEEAAEKLNKLSSAHASFYLALALKKLAIQKVEEEDKNKSSIQLKNVQMALLTRARDALYTTLDRTRRDSKHPLTFDLETELEDIEARIVNVNTSQNGNSDDSRDEDEGSGTSQGSDNRIFPRSSISYRNTSTPRVDRSFYSSRNLNLSKRTELHLRPSPERLDCQIRALVQTQDTVIHTILQQQKELLEVNRQTVSQLKQNHETLEKLIKKMEDIHKSNIQHSSTRSRGRRGHVEDDYSEDYDEAYEGDYEQNGYFDYSLDNGSAAPSFGYQYRPGLNYPAPHPPPPVLHDVHGGPSLGYIPPPPPQSHYRYQYPSSFVSPNRPPPSMMPPSHGFYPHASGTSLPLNEGQPLPQFSFATNQAPGFAGGPQVPEIRPSAFSRLGPVPEFQPPIVTTTDTPTTSAVAATPPAAVAGATASTWIQKPPPHAFQIPLPPHTSLSPAQPPSILSTPPHTATPSPSFLTTPTMARPSGSQLQTLLTTPPSATTKGKIEESPKSRTIRGGYEDVEEEVEGNFKPLIPLPEEVPVCTGEEEEKVLFEERAKLFRYTEKEWRERGVGIVKLLENNEGKVRLLMRRDQVLKVCANHYILPSMKLQPMPGKNTTWIWAAQDFADQEVKLEKFCIKFKTPEIAEKFKEAFENAVKTSQISEKSRPGEISQPASQLVGFGDKFKPKLGSWTCNACYVSNPSEKTSCVACTTAKPGAEKALGPTPGVSPLVSQLIAAPVPVSFPGTFGGITIGKPSAVVPKPMLESTAQQVAVTKSSTVSTAMKKEDTSQEKSVLGGFTFISTPKVQEINTGLNSREIKPSKNIPVQPSKTETSPFAGFNFASALSKDKTKETSEPSAPKPVFGMGSSTNVVTFSDLASSDTPQGFQKSTGFKGFAQSTTPVFGSQKLGEKPLNTSSDAPEEFVPSAVFKPVVPLPDIIDSKTGEEEEEKLFSERGKLFRYDSEGKEWKERGTGEMKILRHSKTKKCRILMRRDQVLKICANHNILPGMTLKPLSSSDRAWVWSAQDYSEGDLRHEQLAIKFKTPEIAQQFQKVFMECQKEDLSNESGSSDKLPPVMTKSSEAKPPLSEMFKPKPGAWECKMCYVSNSAEKSVCIACETPKTAVPVPSSNLIPLSEMFKPKPGAWECETCYVSNPPDKSVCVACETTNPNSSPQVSKQSASAEKFATVIQGTGFPVGSQTDSVQPKFGMISTTKTETTSPPKSQGFVFGQSPVNASSSVSAYTFGATLAKADSEVSSTTGSNNTSLFDFKFQSAASEGTPFQAKSMFGDTNAKGPVQFRFGSPQTFEFSFSGVRPRSPSKTPKSPVAPTSPDSVVEEEETLESPEADIYFHPVIPLPPKVDVKTGEEEEEVLYSHRAKLYRFVSGEWKERGLGEMKILQHKQTRKIRLLMRREQVLKVCLNHWLQESLEVVKKDDKTVMWVATDYSDEEPSVEKLALRFKTSEIAQEFLRAVENAKQKIKQPQQSTPSETTPPTKGFSLASRFGASSTVVKNLFGNTPPKEEISKDAQSSSEEDIEVIYEVKPTAEKVALAEKLMLPSNFFNYEIKPDCPGCIGCKDEIPLPKQVRIPLVQSSPGKEALAEVEEITVVNTADSSTDPSETGDDFSAFTKSSFSKVSFADLAAQTSSFSKQTSPSSDKTVLFAGAGTPVFKSPSRAEENEEDGEVTSSADIHFEPVIPLPDLVDVKTGEEEEEVVFSHRAKLYRYDLSVKQWKERGVGDIKILKHKDSCRYRILMRRDQVHKIACNHYLTPELIIKELSTSNTALTWSAIDYSEGQQTTELFSVKFKTKEVSQEFKAKWEECQKLIEESKKDETNVSDKEQPKEETAELSPQSKDDDEMDEEEEEDDEEDVMFEKRVTLAVQNSETNEYEVLGIGSLQIAYDDTCFGARIRVKNDDGEILCETIIAVQTCLQTDNKNAFWSAPDMNCEPLKRRHFRATFSSQKAVEEFSQTFHEGKDIAVSIGIVETIDEPPKQKK